MSNIMDLSIGYSIDISEGCWQIELSHIIKSEVAKRESTWTKFGITISVSSTVTNPNVESLIGKIKSWR